MNPMWLLNPMGGLLGGAAELGANFGHGLATGNAPPSAVAHGDAARDAPAAPGGLFGSIGRGFEDFGRGLSQEGLAGLLDPMGMLDRQSAQRELAGRFHVRAPGEAAPAAGGAGNNIDEAEFERIARTYSDIRRGRSDLHLDTAGVDEAHRAAFQHDAMGDIGDIMQTPAGRELIGGLANQTDHHQTTIHLRTDAAGNPDNSNAEGGAVSTAPAGSWADGHGTDAEVTYVPGAAGGIVQPGRPDAFLPMRSDVTLFHELTHAHHAAYGTLDQTTLAAGPGVHADDVGQNGMEYQAVGLGAWAGNTLTENTYRDQRRAIGAAGEGTRSVGGVTDAAMPHRDTYVWHDPPAPTP